MADVFISYAHTTSKQARACAAALRAAGFSVWLDDDLSVHRAFTPEIEAQLSAASAALVIWSADAGRSHWVLSEANRAREEEKLVQLVIDQARLPMPFDQLQCADFVGWAGENEHPNWRRVVASLRELVTAKSGEAPKALPAAHEPADAEPLLAVLAFDNLSGDPEMVYFSDGVSEEIQQTVARAADLRLIGRASSFQFRGADKAAAHIAQALNATHVLDGSVRRSGTRVRIVAQLIECRSETTLWSDRYDRDLTDIFALQDEIAAAVAAALKTTFAKSSAQPIDPVAFDLFLRALKLGEATAEDQRKRLKMLEAVVARAPGFARAWAILARDRAISLMYNRQDHAADGLTPALVAEAAQTALRLDSQMGLAYQALAFAEPWAAYGTREKLHEKALAAAPNDVIVLSTYRLSHSIVGRAREALAVVRRAYALDPLSSAAAVGLGVQLRVVGDVDEGTRVTEAAFARWPENMTLAHNVALAAAERGDALRLEAVARAAPGAVSASRLRTFRAIASRNVESYHAILEDLRSELARTGTLVLDMSVSCLYVNGFTDEVFDLLDRAAFPDLFRDSASPFGPYHPGMLFNSISGLYRDLRFPRLCAKLGLADYWLHTGKWPDCADDVPYNFRAEISNAIDTKHRGP